MERKTMMLSDMRWEDSERTGKSYFVANADFNGETIKVTKLDFSCSSSYESAVISQYLAARLHEESAIGHQYLRVSERGENYAVYDVMWYDTYNECYQSVSYLVVYDAASTYCFSAYLG